MNERIRLLAEEAGLQPYYAAQEQHIQKFSELLIRECYEWAKKNGGLGAEYDYDALKEHFGIEE